MESQEQALSDIKNKDKKMIQSSKTYGIVTAISMMLNTAIGTGMLNLPNKIARASITTSMIVTIIIGLVQYICGQHLLDVIQRTHLILKYEQLQNEMMTSKTDQQSISLTVENIDQNNEQQNKIKGDQDFKLDINQNMPNTQLSCSYLCQKYYGKLGFFIYQISNSILIFFVNVSYTNVTASSLSSIIPMKFLLKDGEQWECNSIEDFKKESCDASYWIYVAILCIVALCLMWFDLSSQAILQNFFTVCRLGVLILVCIVTIYCLCTTEYLPHEQYVGQNNYINPNIVYFDFDFKNFGLMASSLTFSLIYHHGIPIILQPVDIKGQQKLQLGFIINSIILMGFTILIALPAALYFGSDSLDLVTLNFSNWNGKDFSGGKSTVIALIIKYLMRILPPIYIIFCIPVRGLIMSGNLLELFNDKVKSKKWLQPVLNISCIIPSILIGGIFKDLSVLINFTSLFGYVVIFVGEPLLIKCNKISKQYNIPSRYPLFNKNWIAYIILLWLLFSLVFTFYSLIA